MIRTGKISLLVALGAAMVNAQGLINANEARVGTTNHCAPSGGTDTYACTITGLTAITTGGRYSFLADVANTGAASINFTALGAKTIKKVQGAVTTDLADNDIRAGQVVELMYDGTNMQMVSQLGNAPAGGGGVASLVDTYANIVAAANSNGQLGFPSSGSILDMYRNNGSAWQALNAGRVMPAWDETTFAWVNQGSASLILDNGSANPPKGSVLATDTTASQIRARLKTSPGTGTDWSIAARMRGVWLSGGQMGIALRVSGTDAWWVYHIFSDSGDNNFRARVVTYTSAASGGPTARTSAVNQFMGDTADLCVYNNSGSGNLEFKMDNGSGYVTLLTIAANTMGAVNQYGYYGMTAGSANRLFVLGLKEVAGDCAAF